MRVLAAVHTVPPRLVPGELKDEAAVLLSTSVPLLGSGIRTFPLLLLAIAPEQRLHGIDVFNEHRDVVVLRLRSRRLQLQGTIHSITPALTPASTRNVFVWCRGPMPTLLLALQLSPLLLLLTLLLAAPSYWCGKLLTQVAFAHGNGYPASSTYNPHTPTPTCTCTPGLAPHQWRRHMNGEHHYRARHTCTHAPSPATATATPHCSDQLSKPLNSVSLLNVLITIMLGLLPLIPPHGAPASTSTGDTHTHHRCPSS
ncbi:hypothetical protein K438DRAFT_1992217 [Mycena galopus ATCC 62051]|nr:hypothetical protein K438DRAFT_1992217 [Mycena galopus ATCC 62051]